MADRTIVDELKILINDEQQEYHNPPTLCRINKIYDDGFIDIETNLGVINHVECIGTPVVNNKGLLVFVDVDC